MLLTVTDAWGITDGYTDVEGRWHETPVETRAVLRAAMGEPVDTDPEWFVPAGWNPPLQSRCHLRLEDGTEIGPVDRLPPDLPIGYHELIPDDGPTTFLVIHPPTVPAPPDVWGVAAQLYSLRSEGSQGIGDLADLAALLGWCQRQRAGAVLLSPLHAPSPTFPQQDSPYYASSRRWWNPLHLRVPGLPADDGPGLVNRDEVWRLKRSALQSWFITSSMGPGWRRWVEQQGDSLLGYARWCALAERHTNDWRSWPHDVRRPDAPGAAALTLDDLDVGFHAWCQWLVGRQLTEARRAGPDVALIGDLAVGFDPWGADAWAYQDTLALECRVGAPPDPFSAAGQDWGLPPFVPARLRAQRYRPFIETVRAAFHGFSGLRIDHVMGLFRQWWVPPGGTAKDGAYVRFPAEQLLAVLRIEATRAGAFVVGEDLGTVEAGVREAMAESGILGTRVALFEAEPPTRFPPAVLATFSTHDLPPLAAIWQHRDGTDGERQRLAELTRATGGTLTDEVILAAHDLLARSPARLRLATIDDLLASTARPNVPGTVDEHPNWRHRLPAKVEEFDRRALVRASTEAFRAARRPQAGAGA